MGKKQLKTVEKELYKARKKYKNEPTAENKKRYLEAEKRFLAYKKEEAVIARYIDEQVEPKEIFHSNEDNISGSETRSVFDFNKFNEWVKKENKRLKSKPKNRPLTQTTLERLKELVRAYQQFNSGQSSYSSYKQIEKAIARKYDIDRKTLTKWLEDNRFRIKKASEKRFNLTENDVDLMWLESEISKLKK